MIISTQRIRLNRFARLYLPTFLNIVVATTWFLALADTARADVPDRIRVMTAAKRFSGTELVAAAYTGEAPIWMRAHHLEWSIGVLHGAGDVRPLIAAGPVWRFQRPTSSLFVEFSFNPTILGGSRLGDRDLGGNFHFTSSTSVGATFGARENISVALRVQHTSNGGLSGTNPGLDMIGLNFAFNLSD